MLRRTAAAVVAALLLAQGVAHAAEPGKARVVREPWGQMPDGRPVELYTLTNSKGSSVSISTYGGTLVSVRVPDKAGRVGDVLLGYETLHQYITDSSPYFGALVGRVANRIARGTFKVDGVEYHVPINNKPNALHGGPGGYDKRVWTAEVVKGDVPTIRLTLVDPAGEQGFPGTVHVAATFSFEVETLRIHYEATTDKPTPINLTQHGYWNLRDGGRSPVTDELMRWQANHYLPVDDVQIPTGEVASVAGTPFDFRHWKSIGQDLAAAPDSGGVHGFDHTMVIDGDRGHLRRAVELYDPVSGRTLEMATTEPGVQMYSGNFLDGVQGRDGARYERYHAVALEAQGFPDAINHPTFPETILKPGEIYKQTTEFKFGVSEREPK
jgi:aldose 1-epimerase